MNCFIYRSAAERYARGRPYFHPHVIHKIKEFLALQKPYDCSLDIGCGTGQSALALKEISDYVVATDVSAAMLSQAPPDRRILYIQAAAESLPMAGSHFDLATVSLAFQWFDRTRFFTEAYRLLRKDGWLIIYNNGLMGQMRENQEYDIWLRDVFMQRFPAPSRDKRPLTDEQAIEHGFKLVKEEEYTIDLHLTADELIAYLTTHSRVIAAIESGNETIESVLSWLISSIAPMFATLTSTFAFGGEILYLRKT
jgi:ubiquinone/menaquinone biosynthesis C-methylase UbiE